MSGPTDEQEAILKNKARVRLVCASPGSGKTWLVAEIIRDELATWPAPTKGIAALSFTHVGGDEIRKAVGYELGHPHFVGTIDAFLFRYVLRPFLRLCHSDFAEPRLIPGEWGAQHWMNCGNGQKAIVGGKRGINLFSCVWLGEKNGQAMAAYKPSSAAPLQELRGSDLELVKTSKARIWKNVGQFTHSDAALWASKLLENVQFGKTIRSEITRRFPLLIVDELQDTGYFLGKSLRLLLKEPEIRGVLVGDPDQSIYEFSGARPDDFGHFAAVTGTVTLPLSTSRRCPGPVASAARHLKDSGGVFNPAIDQHGRAILVYYETLVNDVLRLLQTLGNTHKNARLEVIARGKATVDALSKRDVKPAPPLHCRPLTHILRGVVAFRQQRNDRALAAARAAIEQAVYGQEGMTDQQLVDHNVDLYEWRSLAIRYLLGANSISTDQNLFDWQKTAGKLLDKELTSLGQGMVGDTPFIPGRLKPKARTGHDLPLLNFMPDSQKLCDDQSNWRVRTVHAVKGETHDFTVFVCPDPGKTNYCPSVVWWSGKEKDREEKRIAYVAATRTRGHLVICVSKACHQRLCNSRKEFVEAFESMSVDEFIVNSATFNPPSLQPSIGPASLTFAVRG